jgi:spermidine synthase
LFFAAFLAFLSGAAGLVWQIAWTTQLGLILGHELVSVLAVMAGFFGGLAAGAFFLANRIERATRPGRWYAALEALTGFWGLLVVFSSATISSVVTNWLGTEPPVWQHWLVAFTVPLICLLPATLAMGASMPALERQCRAASAHALRLLYAWNTAGAMVGVLAATFWLLPSIGLKASATLFAVLNLVCALLAFLKWRTQSIGAPATPLTSPQQTLNTPHRPNLKRLQAALFGTGLLGIGYEVLVVRVLSQVIENTVYSYTLLLAVFLLGTALGARLLRSTAEPPGQQRVDHLLVWLAISVLVSGCSLWWADRWVALPAVWLGVGQATALAGETLAALAALLWPAMVMGALFAELSTQALASGSTWGRALGINTLGASVAPVLVGAALVPLLGAQIVLVLLVLGYLALSARITWRQPKNIALAAAAFVLLVVAPPLRFVDVPDQGRILSYRDGIMAAVSVVEDASGTARLHINNRVQEGSSASGLVETRLAQLPLLLHPAPRTALFLGLGTGYTAQAAAIDPTLRVQAVELLPEVVEASQLFALKPGAPKAAWPVPIATADARRFVQAKGPAYDVIVADLFHPARSGAAYLYTREHFRAVTSRLADGGVFCQWLALHQMDLASLRSISAAFMQVYPNAVLVLASNSLDTPVLGLVARNGGAPWSIDGVAARFQNQPTELTSALKLARIDDAYAVLGSVLADPQSLRNFIGTQPANTDDHPIVAHMTASVDYSPQDTPPQRLAALLLLLQPRLQGVTLTDADQRLLAYWQARHQYLAVGLQTQTRSDPERMLAQLSPALLAVAKMSADFHPAAESLASLANAALARNPQSALAKEVLAALRIKTPTDPTTK